MKHPEIDLTEPSPFGRRMRDARDAAGLSINAAWAAVTPRLTRPVSASMIQRIETDPNAEEKASVELVVHLCGIYGVDPYAMSVSIADAWNRSVQASPVVLLTRNSRGGNGAGEGTTTRAYSHAPQAARQAA